MLRLSFMFMFASIGTSGQLSPKDIPERAASVSCTSKVEASACKWTQAAFLSAQKASTAMRSVEVVIADSEAFKLELERLRIVYSSLTKASPSATEHNKLT